jgi:peptidoglycan hydrolase-like protein with peptidoglycan-binding domain
MLQLRLRGMGLYNGPIDGVLGQRSREAVREFQKSQAVQVDGIPGPKTVSILLTKIGMNADE